MSVPRTVLIKRQQDRYGNGDQTSADRQAGDDDAGADAYQRDAQPVCRFDCGIMQSILKRPVEAC